MSGLHRLPVELLLNIWIMSYSKSLPLTCRHILQACRGASSVEKAEYILGRWADCFIAYLASGKSCSSRHSKCRRSATHLFRYWNDPSGNRFQAWYGLHKYFNGSPPCLEDVLSAGLGVATFAAEFQICNAALFDRIIECARLGVPEVYIILPLNMLIGRLADDITFQDAMQALKVERTKTMSGERPTSDIRKGIACAIKLPKRLFRSIGRHHFDVRATASARDEESQEGRRQRRRICTADSYPDWLAELLVSLSRRLPRADSASNAYVAAERNLVPPPGHMEMIFVLLYRYGADASSHDGYPLAMAVLNQAYSLVHLLLLFGADPNRKDGLAGKLAIQNGFLDILHLMVTGPSFAIDAPATVPFEAAVKPQIGSGPFLLNHDHLKLAIKSQQWEVVDYIWHERNVVPNMECLRLLERLRQ